MRRKVARMFIGAVCTALIAIAILGLVRMTVFCIHKHRQASSVATMRLIAKALDSYIDANRGRFPPVDTENAPFLLPWHLVAPYAADTPPDIERRIVGYCYPGYAVQDEIHGLYFLIALREGCLAGPYSEAFSYAPSDRLPGFEDGPTVMRIMENVYRFIVRIVLSPPAGAMPDPLPVLWEMPSLHGTRGGVVLYGDRVEWSKVEWVKCPGKFPMVPEFVEAVEEIRTGTPANAPQLEGRWYCLIDYPVGSASEDGYLYQAGRMVLVPFPHKSLFDRRIALAKNDGWKGDPPAKHWVADSRHLYGVIDVEGRAVTINDLTDDVELVLRLDVPYTGQHRKMEGTLRFQTPVTTRRFLSGERSLIRAPGPRGEYTEDTAEQVARVTLERKSAEIPSGESLNARPEGCTIDPADNWAP